MVISFYLPPRSSCRFFFSFLWQHQTVCMVACMASCHLHIPGGDCFPHSLLYFCHALAFGCMGYLPQHTLLSRSHTHTHTHSCARERADVMWLTGSCLCAWCSCLCAIVERGGSGFKAFGLCVCVFVRLRAFARFVPPHTGAPCQVLVGPSFAQVQCILARTISLLFPTHDFLSLLGCVCVSPNVILASALLFIPRPRQLLLL